MTTKKSIDNMIKIFHNPRCSKSRQGLEILTNSKQDFEIVKYLENPISEEELIDILEKLNISPIDLIRKGEAIWKEQYKGKTLTQKEIIQAMVKNPKLIERPIVVNGDKATIGRPPISILEII